MTLLGDMAVGALLRCPACRKGRMFASWTRMHESCPTCGVRFEPARGEFTGPVMIGQGVFALVAIMGWYVLRVWVLAPAWLQWTWLLGFAAAPLVLYRNLKGAWVGLLAATRGLPRS